jgi:hypothetical protein
MLPKPPNLNDRNSPLTFTKFSDREWRIYHLRESKWGVKMGKIRKEKQHSIALAKRTKVLVLATFEGQICEKCKKEPAARIISNKFLCHNCATSSCEPAQSRAVSAT